MISDAETYEGNEGMKGISSVEYPRPELRLTEEELKPNKYHEARESTFRMRNHRRIRDFSASLNRILSSLFSAISVAERQIAILKDLQGLFLTSCPTKIKDYEKEYPLPQNRFYKNIAPIPIFSENSEQIWGNTLDAIDVVIRERKCFIKKVKELVENMEIRRKNVCFPHLSF